MGELRSPTVLRAIRTAAGGRTHPYLEHPVPENPWLLTLVYSCQQCFMGVQSMAKVQVTRKPPDGLPEAEAIQAGQGQTLGWIYSVALE